MSELNVEEVTAKLRTAMSAVDELVREIEEEAGQPVEITLANADSVRTRIRTLAFADNSMAALDMVAEELGLVPAELKETR